MQDNKEKEEILLDALNELGDFESVDEQFSYNDLACIFQAMEVYKNRKI